MPNGDFESAAGCTSTLSNLNWQTNWGNAGGSCDFFTACNMPDVWHSWWFVTYMNFYVTYPSNCFGNQTSSGHGNSYAGLITTSFSTQFPWFEYTQTELACSLITGQRYHVWETSEQDTKARLQNLIFPKGITFDKKNGVLLTLEINEAIAEIARSAGDSPIMKKGLSTYDSTKSPFAEKEGFEPPEV